MDSQLALASSFALIIIKGNAMQYAGFTKYTTKQNIPHLALPLP